jgi:ACT domain-containing protein
MTNFNATVIKHKAGLLNLAKELGNISKACKIMGYSRDTFYRYQAALPGKAALKPCWMSAVASQI